MAQRPRAAWLFYGGAVGSGKTHICTAVSRELMRGGLRLRYMLWTEEVARLKGLIGEEGYEEELRFYRTAPALYIDDFFKPVRDLAGVVQPPSAADVRLAYDIVNARYLRPELRTIFSSERWLSEIIALDEAVGSRIAERARDFIVEVARMPGRNRRYA